MSIVNIRDVTFLNNPARFSDEYQFRVTFECIAPLKEGKCPFASYALKPNKLISSTCTCDLRPRRSRMETNLRFLT